MLYNEEELYYPGRSRNNYDRMIMLQVHHILGSGEAAAILVTGQRTWSGIGFNHLGGEGGGTD